MTGNIAKLGYAPSHFKQEARRVSQCLESLPSLPEETNPSDEMRNLIIRKKLSLDNVSPQEEFARDKAQKSINSAVLHSLSNGNVFFGISEGQETLGIESKFTNMCKQMESMKTELAEFREKHREHDRHFSEHDELFARDRKNWMAVRKRNFLTWSRRTAENTQEKSSWLGRTKQQISKSNKLVHHADLVTDIRMIEMFPDYIDGPKIFESIYPCSPSVAKFLRTSGMTYIIKTVNMVANYELRQEDFERGMSLDQEKVAKELNLCLGKINPDNAITPEEIASLKDICNRFRAAKKKRS